MRKTVFMLACLVMVSVSALADRDWGGVFGNSTPECVQLYLINDGPGEEDHSMGHRQPPLLPVLGYEGNTFVLSVPYELEDVTIVIRGEDGLVLCYDVVSSITDYYMFLLTDDIIADMYSIELYYGDWHLYGEF